MGALVSVLTVRIRGVAGDVRDDAQSAAGAGEEGVVDERGDRVGEVDLELVSQPSAAERAQSLALHTALRKMSCRRISS